MLKKTIVFITHDFDEAIRLADRIAIMKDGKVVQTGTPEELVLNPADEYVAEFTHNVTKAKVVRVHTIMKPLPEKTPRQGYGGTVQASEVVADVAPLIETQSFFAELLRTNESAVAFLQSDFRMLNQPLAAHYGIDGPRGGEFERVELKADEGPGGLLTHASILLSNSTGEDSHPIERGVWIRKVLLNDPPAPPPPAVPNLDNGDTDAALLPLKRQLEIHLDNAACAQCHKSIDPWGVALEEFDAIGRRRQEIVRFSGDREARIPVDAAATLPDGEQVDGVDELTAYLTRRRKQDFARALTSKMLTYALGRSLEFSDEETVDHLTERFIESGYGLRDLVTMIVTHEVFRRG